MWEEGIHIYGTPGVHNNFSLETPFFFWVMRWRASTWDCELYASIGGANGEREREREILVFF